MECLALLGCFVGLRFPFQLLAGSLMSTAPETKILTIEY